MKPSPPPSEHVRSRPGLRHVALLLVLAVAIRLWTIPHAAVPARDGIGFMRYAWQLEHDNWFDVLRASHHPPAFPVSILAIGLPLRLIFGDAVLPLCAQFAGALAGIVLVIPMYFLGLALFDRRTGFWAALLFQCFPVSGRVLSDALSEPLFLLASTTTLLWAVRAMTSRNREGVITPRSLTVAARFFFCGLGAGLAYLTRPEGALLLVAVSLVLPWVWLRFRWQLRTVAACGLGLWLGAAVLAGPYIAVTGHFTQKPTGQKVFDGEGQVRSLPGASGPLLAMWHANDSSTGTSQRLAWSAGAVFAEVFKGYHYIGCFLLPLGVWWFRARLWQAPGAMVLLLLMVLHAALLVRVAMVSGYVSERHALVIVLCGLFWVVAALGLIGERLATWLSAKPIATRFVPVTLLFLLAVSGLPRTLQPLHAHRRGFREAGRWLAAHTTATDVIVDPFGWATHYAGRTFQEAANTLPSQSLDRYFVWDCSKQSYRRAEVDAAQVKQWQQGQAVYHWPVQAPLEKATVVVYFLPAVHAGQ